MLWNTSIYNDLDGMRKDMDALSEMLGGTGNYRTSFPRINVFEDKDGFTLAADVPGVPREKLEVRCDDDTLTLYGERPRPTGAGHQRRILRQERETGSFEKIFRFPGRVDAGAIKARLENGILTVRIPKSEDAKPRRIDIRF